MKTIFMFYFDSVFISSIIDLSSMYSIFNNKGSASTFSIYGFKKSVVSLLLNNSMTYSSTSFSNFSDIADNVSELFNKYVKNKTLELIYVSPHTSFSSSSLSIFNSSLNFINPPTD